MTEQPKYQAVCREWLGEERGECGKVATHIVERPDIFPDLYKCRRHIRRFQDTIFIVKEIT